MHTETIQKWTAALRSGKYLQGKGRLYSHDDYRGDFYCCLGVLCAVQDPNWLDRQDVRYEPAYDQSNVPDVFDPGLSEGAQEKLASMNDGGTSFEDIAEFIETGGLDTLEEDLARERAEAQD